MLGKTEESKEDYPLRVALLLTQPNDQISCTYIGYSSDVVADEHSPAESGIS